MSAPIDLTILVYETAIVFEGETDSYRQRHCCRHAGG